ncbi:hypothetical protein NQZ68_030123 [Dissostichus eleginoides]|nr:hypothetical protein NQZ68_030123 [Dissostichus eleginoides]
MKNTAGRREESEEEEEEEEDQMDAFYPQALRGFIMVMTEEGELIYLTESVSRHIGLTQLELLGQSVYDFVHPCDQEELRDLLTTRPGLRKKPLAEQPSERNFFLRVKSTLTSRGRTVNIKSAAWKVIHCTGHLRQLGGGSTSPPAGRVMTLLCEPIPHPSSVEFPLDTCTFLTRHSMDLRFTHCKGRVTELMGYKPEDLIGCSAYEFYHALDSHHVNKSLQTLLSKGQVSTRHYRFLANSGGFVWAETQATVLYSSRTSLPEAVVCLNFILSGVEQPDVVFSVEQTRCGRLPEAEPQPAEDSGMSDLSQSDSGSECLTSPGQSEDAGSILSPVAELFLQVKEELLKEASEAEDPITPLTGDFLELSFCSPRGQSSVPEHPQDLCTPQLRQPLSPIFSPVTPPSASSPCSSPEDQLSPCEEGGGGHLPSGDALCWSRRRRGRDTGGLLEEVIDLDMLAPYISMDDDFQLSVLSSVPEDDKPASSKASSGRPADTASRKRTHNPDEELLMIEDKRQKAPSIHCEALNYPDCLEEINQSDCFVQPGPAHRQRPCSGGHAGTL